MNIIGVWKSKNSSKEAEVSWPSGSLELRLGYNLTVIEEKFTKLIYEGIIFDRTPDELIDSQTALDNAYGLYSYVKINRDKQDIIIGTDKLGFSPINYSISGENLYFSTSLTLLKYQIGKVSPDYEAWDEMLNLSTVLGEKTTIREIKRLNAGTRIHMADGKISFNNYWSPEIPGKANVEKFVNTSNELLEESLELTRGTGNRKVILLSGGEDGRRIGVSARKIGLPVSFATQESGFLQGYDDNIIIAERVSEYLNFPHIKSGLPNAITSLSDMRTRDYWLGYETHYHDWIIPLLRVLPPASLIYDGIAGDVTINGHWARLFPERYLNNDIDRIAGMFCGETKTFHLDAKRLDSSLFERVREQLLCYPDCPARVDYFYLMNRARRTISLMHQLFRLMGHRVCCPFLYYPLFMQSLSLDPKYKMEVLYQRLCMEDVEPGISTIPSTRDKLNDEYLIDKSREVAEKNKLIVKNIRIRSDISDIFPSLGTRIWAFKMGRILNFKKMTSRLMWRIAPLSRMSAFLDWLDDFNIPTFPITVDAPEFLKRNLIS